MKINDKYIMSFDQGTSSSRCIIYDREGNIISKAQKEHRQIYPQGGWVEHDPMEIWENQKIVAFEALTKAGLTSASISAIGITNQRETTIVWDKDTGKPVYNAIVWQCRRTADFCDTLRNQLQKKGLDRAWREKTGLPIDPYFSATKIRWILDHVDGAREKAKKGRLLFGTVDSWLLWNLTQGRVHSTDYSNASRTMLYNIRDLCWDEEIIETLDIPKSMLPQVRPSSQVYGETKLFGGSIPVSGSVGDQQAALFGQACFHEGEAKNTFGTGGFLLVNTADRIVPTKSGLISTIAWGLGSRVTYAQEGSVFVSGAAMQWLRDELGLISDASESEAICRSIKSTEGVYLVPAFTGLGAPWWDPYARGTLVGLTRGSGRRHIVRAAVEAMVYQTCDLLSAMEEDMEAPLKTIKVDGGAARDGFLLEFLANMQGQDVCRPKSIETTSLGAAYMAGLAVGYWKDLEDIRSVWKEDRIFTPTIASEERDRLLRGWHKAVGRSRSWVQEEDG